MDENNQQQPQPPYIFMMQQQQQQQQPAARGIGGWHIFHAIMTVLTAGLWIPVWIAHVLVSRNR